MLISGEVGYSYTLSGTSALLAAAEHAFSLAYGRSSTANKVSRGGGAERSSMSSSMRFCLWSTRLSTAKHPIGAIAKTAELPGWSRHGRFLSAGAARSNPVFHPPPPELEGKEAEKPWAAPTDGVDVRDTADKTRAVPRIGSGDTTLSFSSQAHAHDCAISHIQPIPQDCVAEWLCACLTATAGIPRGHTGFSEFIPSAVSPTTEPRPSWGASLKAACNRLLFVPAARITFLPREMAALRGYDRDFLGLSPPGPFCFPVALRPLCPRPGPRSWRCGCYALCNSAPKHGRSWYKRPTCLALSTFL